jgi:broad specificity phosphatase PhoE
MNKEEVATAAYDRASTSLAETEKKLAKAEQVVDEWDTATTKFKNRSLEEWKKTAEKLERAVEDAKQREKDARVAFVAVVSHQDSGRVEGTYSISR